ncbi:MAG: homoserine/homoserine lactone efflux protein [Propionivibrio sp.]
MTLSVWLGFLLATILIAVSPGPGAAVTMSSGLRYGYASALRTIFGLQSALMIQLAIVAVGLGALLTASVVAFDIVQLLGAAYLIWLGIQKWRAVPEEIDPQQVRSTKSRLFFEGLLVNLTNPKAIVFIAALTPQFIDPARPQAPQFLIMAVTMCSVDTIVMSGYALLATRLRGWLQSTRALKAQNRFFGSVFVGAGLLLAGSGRH